MRFLPFRIWSQAEEEFVKPDLSMDVCGNLMLGLDEICVRVSEIEDDTGEQICQYHKIQLLSRTGELLKPVYEVRYGSYSYDRRAYQGFYIKDAEGYSSPLAGLPCRIVSFEPPQRNVN